MVNALRVIVIITIAAGTLAAAQNGPQPATANLAGKLYRSVFSAGPGTLSAADIASTSQPLRERLNSYLSRRAAFKSRYKSQADSFDAVRIDAKRRLLEQSMVALIAAPDIERLAAEYVAQAPIDDDWKGLPDGPLEEASHAESVLKKHPSSPLAPWLYVFIAQRQRVVFEASENQKSTEAMKAAARKYRAFVERARAVEDPIFPALVADMEQLPFLYLKGSTHPRNYNPDG